MRHIYDVTPFFISTMAHIDIAGFNDQMASLRKPEKNYFSIFHLNVRSLCHKEDELVTFLNELFLKFDVVVFSETWLKSESDAFCLESYSMVSTIRSDRRGGGLTAYLNNGKPYYLLPEFCANTADAEVLTVL